MDRPSHPRLLAWWKDNPADPGRACRNDPDVQRLVAAIAPGSPATDLGGVMSLNVRLERAGLVLRVHQPFVSRPRLLALQEVRRLRSRWPTASELPRQLVHGDVRLSDVCRTPHGATVYLDFGFLAVRPRIHELAYALAFMALALGWHQARQNGAWQSVPRLIEIYEAAANIRLTPTERRALAPCTAAVPLYSAALDGFTEDPAGKLRSRLTFLRLSEWLLTMPRPAEAHAGRRQDVVGSTPTPAAPTPIRCSTRPPASGPGTGSRAGWSAAQHSRSRRRPSVLS